MTRCALVRAQKLLEHARAQVEVAERGGFGDLQVHACVVEPDGVVGLNQPARAQLVRVDVHEQRERRLLRERHVANQPPEAARCPFRDRAGEQREGGGQALALAAHQDLVGEGDPRAHVHDRLVGDLDVFAPDLPHTRGDGVQGV